MHVQELKRRHQSTHGQRHGCYKSCHTTDRNKRLQISTRSKRSHYQKFTTAWNWNLFRGTPFCSRQHRPDFFVQMLHLLHAFSDGQKKSVPSMYCKGQQLKAPLHKWQTLETTAGGKWQPGGVASSAKHAIGFACARFDGEAYASQTPFKIKSITHGLLRQDKKERHGHKMDDCMKLRSTQSHYSQAQTGLWNQRGNWSWHCGSAHTRCGHMSFKAPTMQTSQWGPHKRQRPGKKKLFHPQVGKVTRNEPPGAELSREMSSRKSWTIRKAGHAKSSKEF